jgi:UDP-4-amino-4-deoxy-L-arabinose-oxoglutarate aminotransferase
MTQGAGTGGHALNRRADAANAPRRRAELLPFCRPTIEDAEVAEVVEALRSGWLTTGPRVAKFEALFQERLHAAAAVAVNSATGGLHLSVAVLDLKPGDEVIIPSLTWTATANVVELSGARPVFADVDAETLCLDPEDAARRITHRTRAVMPVHYAGQPADLDAFRALARKHGLVIIEDAAHAIGAFYKGVEIGASGDLVVFSFHAIKNATTGEGGMIVCPPGSERWADRLRRLRLQGVVSGPEGRPGRGPMEYDLIEPGWKYNMMDLQAAIGIHQMAKVDNFIARRRALAERYAQRLADVEELRPLGFARYPTVHAWHLYVVQLDPDALDISRAEFGARMLKEENIGVGLHFMPVHTSTYYRRKYGCKRGDLPKTERAGDRILSLPLYPLMKEEDVEDVVRALKRLIGAHLKRRRHQVVRNEIQET